MGKVKAEMAKLVAEYGEKWKKREELRARIYERQQAGASTEKSESILEEVKSRLKELRATLGLEHAELKAALAKDGFVVKGFSMPSKAPKKAKAKAEPKKKEAPSPEPDEQKTPKKIVKVKQKAPSEEEE